MLLIAQSARMLAQSAARAGFRTCVIDGFADADTRRYATQIHALSTGLFDEAELFAALARLAPAGKEIGLIYGSGIDTRPDLVERLALGRTLLGNSPATLRRVKTPCEFFRLLAELAIPHPQTRFSPPQETCGWLVKPGCGEGGKGVRFFAENRLAEPEAYYQRRIEGDALSALFLANGEEARIIGFNTQWTTGCNGEQPFLFAGAINRTDLSVRQREVVGSYIAKLTAALGLVGLNSLDFMLERGMCRVLEINPRPSATMALYDEDYPFGLLTRHVAACRGELPSKRQEPGPVRAFRIIYAPRHTEIRENIPWPDWCADIPNPGANIPAWEPLCSITAQGPA
ncbi:MAG: ATP-grasp domain-containing protein, partial [Methylococcaceae bacterium]|nr:ATP-grasp domain-containing protein [Methylococcaceae bacterium]